MHVEDGPQPGPQDAVPATPPRAPGSARRTTSIDVSRPDGPAGPAVLDVRGQDVRTDGDGAARVVARLAVTLELDQRTGAILRVGARGASRPLGELVGLTARSGFGRALAALMPDDAARRTLPYSALDDLGGAFLVSGYSLLRAGHVMGDAGRAEALALAQADVCTGWATGGPLLETLRRSGRSAVPSGPAAPVIEGDDPLGWHEMAPMATGTVRRRRRLDVAPGPGGVVSQSHFRDSYAADDGEMVMHEYVVDADVDGERRLARVAVQPRVLPWRACPGAVASAQRLVGVAVAEVPARVRRELVGTTTCTHLNSTLRCLADLDALTN